MNTAMDLFFALISVFMVVYGVRRSTRERVALAGVFLLAFLLVLLRDSHSVWLLTISSSVGAAAVHTLYEFGYGRTGEVLCTKNPSP